MLCFWKIDPYLTQRVLLSGFLNFKNIIEELSFNLTKILRGSVRKDTPAQTEMKSNGTKHVEMPGSQSSRTWSGVQMLS